MNTSSSTLTAVGEQQTRPILLLAAFATLLWLGFSAWLQPSQQARQLAAIGGDLAVQLETMAPVDLDSLQRLVDATHYYAQLERISLVYADQDPQAFDLRGAQLAQPDSAYMLSTRTVLVQRTPDSRPVPAQLTIGIARSPTLSSPVTWTLFALLAVLIALHARAGRQASANTATARDSLASQQPEQLDGTTSQRFTSSAQPTDSLAETELALARRSALEASRLKSELIANTSHELLTPLNSIVGYATLLGKTSGLSALQQDFVNKISNSGQHLTALTNDLLDFALHGDRNPRLKYQSCDVGELLQSVCEVLSLDAHSKQLSLLTDFDTLAGMRVQTDPVRLRQIVTNLLVNAIRYTSAGHVLVAAQLAKTDDHHHRLDITISDTGEGMPPELREQVFSALVKRDQLGEQNSGPGQGLGLGLAIVNGIVSQMGGSIELESELQVGSSFRVLLPVAEFETTPGPELPAVQSLLVYSASPATATNLANRARPYTRRVEHCSSVPAMLEKADQYQLLLMDLTAPDTEWAVEHSHPWCIALAQLKNPLRILRPTTIQPAAPLAGLSRPSPASLRQLLHADDLASDAGPTAGHLQAVGAATALLVDDNPSNLKVLALMLNDLGIAADTAHSAATALPQLEQRNYQWLFIDLKMQPVNGMELLATIHRQSLQPHATAVACTAHSSDAEFRALQDAGFDHVLHKPVDISLLATLLADADPQQHPQETPRPATPVVFDTDYALSRTVNRRALAQRNLERLLEELDELLNRGVDLDAGREQATLRVHYVNGSAAMTGALAVKSALDRLESGLKDSATPRLELDSLWRALETQARALKQWHQHYGGALQGRDDAGH